MIEPGKNGRRSGSVAKGRCEAGCFAKSGRPLVRWILTNETGGREARGGRVRDPADAAADAVAAHLRERAGEPVQTDLAKRGWRWDGGRRCRAVHALRTPERPTTPPAPMPMDTGTASALGWINLPTLFLRRFTSFDSCCPSRSGDPKGGILRVSVAVGFNPNRGHCPRVPPSSTAGPASPCEKL